MMTGTRAGWIYTRFTHERSGNDRLPLDMKKYSDLFRLLAIASAVVTAILPGASKAKAAAPNPVDSPVYLHAMASHIMVPQARGLAMPGHGHSTTAVTVREVSVSVDIVEQVATTTLDISFTNTTGRRLEAQMIVPVPDKAALRGFTFQGQASEATAQLLPKEQARRLYDEVVAKTRDPALLEFIGHSVVRSSVFPVEPHAGQKVRMIYEHVLTTDGARIDYTLPRTESIDYHIPWNISLHVKSKTPIATVYSPSHKLESKRAGANHWVVRIAPEATTEPGAFRLSYLLEQDGITASLLAYPDPKIGGGYFLLLAGTPVKTPVNSALKREVILVLDRSGSMAGEKLEQVRGAALQVLEGLEDGEAFNILVYHEAVEAFAPQPVKKNAETMRAARAYLKGLRVRGGTNIHDALVEALRQKPTPGCIPIVLFLTDGLPTVGQTSEKTIREVAAKANPHERRIFTFGVGVDVNTPLLDKIALETRATASFVLPKEDVEVKVGQVFKRLVGPVLATPALRVLDAGGNPALGRVRDMTPAKLPDLFDGDQLVLLGQYVGDDPLTFVLNGNFFGRERSFRFTFSLDKASTRNAFVPRLWASRQIANLTESIRDLGADGAATAPPAVPRVKELVDEIVRLSKEFGILTEYTAFFAREGTDLTQPAHVALETLTNFQQRAMAVRSGYGSVNQSFNNNAQLAQTQINARNGYWDANLNRISISTVQQVNDRAFFRRGNRWVDSALVSRPESDSHSVVEVGSEPFRRLVERLAQQSRQGCLALRGEILIQVDGETFLVR
jgi:Ca-activated chloride channel homolog